MFVALVLLGVALRAAVFAADRDLWIDESMLALNLLERSPAQLLEPLDRNQGAPVGFLLLSKAAITQVGVSERSLRLVSFVGSVLGLIAFAWVGPRLLPRPAALLALALLVVSPYLLSYSAECKQYATDAAWTVWLFAAAAGLLCPRPGDGERLPLVRWVGLALAGAVAVWFSHPSVFVLGGIGTALLADAAWARDRSRFLAACAAVGTWLASFGACYVLFLKALSANSYLLEFWAHHFLPLPPSKPGDLAWLVDHFFALFAYPGGLSGGEVKIGGLAAILFVIGAWGMARERWPLAVAVVLPGALALLASSLHKYPFGGRLLLFLVPLLVLGVARGAWAVASALRPVQPMAAFALVGTLLAAPCLEAYQEVRRPQRTESITAVLDTVRAEWQPGDRMYLYYGAEPAFLFYTRNEPFPPEAVVVGTEPRKERLEFRNQLVPFVGAPRVWLVFSHLHEGEEPRVLAYAEGLGRCLRAHKVPGATAYLFDFSAPPRGGQVTAAGRPPAPSGAPSGRPAPSPGTRRPT
jgi:hypothetical protein